MNPKSNFLYIKFELWKVVYETYVAFKCRYYLKMFALHKNDTAGFICS
jgi:hypothetical protein